MACGYIDDGHTDRSGRIGNVPTPNRVDRLHATRNRILRCTRRSDKHKRKGVLVVELAVSLTLISIIAGLTAVAMIRYRDVRSNFEWRRSAMALAVGQLVKVSSWRRSWTHFRHQE